MSERTTDCRSTAAGRHRHGWRMGLIVGLVLMATAVGAEEPTVTTGAASAVGRQAMTMGGRIHPHGQPTRYFIEYGTTADYGNKTEPAPLPPKLAAFYRESWNAGLGGWLGGMSAEGLDALVHHPQGGAPGGFVRFTEPGGNDPNHDDGIGTLHLPTYLYPGTLGPDLGRGSVFLGGGDPDLRGARVTLMVRGNNWQANGSELVWWTQSQSNIEVGIKDGWRRANWAYTGFSLNDFLRSGKWEKVSYRLLNDAARWTYGGNNHSQSNYQRYSYWPIDLAQRHLNCDFFHLLTFIDRNKLPSGSIDFDDIEIAYRNHSLLLPSNGGRLVEAPSGSTDKPAALTDGWRHGKGRAWRSGENPAGPLEFVYTFAKPVTIETVQLHQHTAWPARAVEVIAVAAAGGEKTLFDKELPERATGGANFSFAITSGHSVKAKGVKVRITSGYKPQYWGLGEIELFGRGATMRTDDDLYHVNTDITGLEPGTTYHYRLVAESSAGTVRGSDRTHTTPADATPRARTGAASRITATTARIAGRMNPLGLKTQFHFEYGPTTSYGSNSPVTYGGLQITPRTVLANLTSLKPNTTYHYRLVATNAQGTTHGADQTFRTAK